LKSTTAGSDQEADVPVIRVESDVSGVERREAFVEELANELAGSGRGDAVIFEIPVRQTDTYHIIVVWDAWRLVAPEERSAIILDAYEKREAQKQDQIPKAAQVTLAMGLTWADPLLRHALPYRIESHARSQEADARQIERALLDEGAVRTPNGLQLRFPTQETAERAWARLQGRMPDAHWAVVGEGPTLDD
jgi:hypothetical protein